LGPGPDARHLLDAVPAVGVVAEELGGDGGVTFVPCTYTSIPGGADGAARDPVWTELREENERAYLPRRPGPYCRSSTTETTFGSGDITASFTCLPLSTITKVCSIGNGSPGMNTVVVPVQSGFTL
jgi:hypothetical protein